MFLLCINAAFGAGRKKQEKGIGPGMMKLLESVYTNQGRIFCKDNLRSFAERRAYETRIKVAIHMSGEARPMPSKQAAASHTTHSSEYI